ncbi:acyltransferase [bacterium]|nr:MAG: acyltransferase [bacterium]
MLFPTATFAVFFLVVMPLAAWLKAPSPGWKRFVLAASYVFYAWWDWRFVFLLGGSTVVNWMLGQAIARAGASAGRWWLGLAVAFNLAVLGFFKYYGFFVASADAALRPWGLASGLPYLDIVLPVGISFYTFQGISYVVDVYRRQVPAATLLDFAIYPAFFPHLVAGPIVRAAEFLPQLRAPDPLRRRDVSRAGWLIAQGAFKKVVVSTFLAGAIVDPVFAVPADHSGLEIALAIYGYAVQIYADFSGYTDMAIGIALLMGIRFPQNFDRPYAAESIADFWRRWHMTLSRWLRDYLYIPLGGSRHGAARTYRNLVLTMTLGGLWHGAAATFVAWGVFHGLGLAVERWWRGRGRDTDGGPTLARRSAGARSAVGRGAARIATFHFVCLGWVLFRAETFDGAVALLQGLARPGPAPLATAAVAAAIGASLAVQQLPPGWSARLEARFAHLPLAFQGAALGLFFAFTAALGPEGVAPFIYFQF